jgi:hypothetical protein
MTITKIEYDGPSNNSSVDIRSAANACWEVIRPVRLFGSRARRLCVRLGGPDRNQTVTQIRTEKWSKKSNCFVSFKAEYNAFIDDTHMLPEP